MKNKYLPIFAIGLGLGLAAVWLLSLSAAGVPGGRAASLTVCPDGQLISTTTRARTRPPISVPTNTGRPARSGSFSYPL
jgi:hypothetical protein